MQPQMTVRVSPFVSSKLLDRTERIAVLALYVYFVVNIGLDIAVNRSAPSLVLLISETVVLIFMLLRRPSLNITSRPLDWLLGFAGTTLPLIVRPSGMPLLPQPIILVVMLAGFALQITAKFFLRRSFGLVAANRGIKVDGPYRIIRHPMYAGYMLTELGFLLGNPSLFNLAVYAATWCIQIGRILAEERLLAQDQAFRDLVARVPYRLLPPLF